MLGCCIRYAENQQLLSARESVLTQQADVIRQLERRLQEATGTAAGRSQKQRIKELEQQVVLRGWGRQTAAVTCFIPLVMECL